MIALRERFKKEGENYCQVTIPYAFTTIYSTIEVDNFVDGQISYRDDPDYLAKIVLDMRQGKRDILKRIAKGELEIIEIDDDLIAEVMGARDPEKVEVTDDLIEKILANERISQNSLGNSEEFKIMEHYEEFFGFGMDKRQDYQEDEI